MANVQTFTLQRSTNIFSAVGNLPPSGFEEGHFVACRKDWQQALQNRVRSVISAHQNPEESQTPGGRGLDQVVTSPTPLGCSKVPWSGSSDSPSVKLPRLSEVLQMVGIQWALPPSESLPHLSLG